MVGKLLQQERLDAFAQRLCPDVMWRTRGRGGLCRKGDESAQGGAWRGSLPLFHRLVNNFSALAAEAVEVSAETRVVD